MADINLKIKALGKILSDLGFIVTSSDSSARTLRSLLTLYSYASGTVDEIICSVDNIDSPEAMTMTFFEDCWSSPSDIDSLLNTYADYCRRYGESVVFISAYPSI